MIAPGGGRIVAHYWGIESARKNLTSAATSGLVSETKNPQRHRKRQGDSFIAGAGFEPATFGL